MLRALFTVLPEHGRPSWLVLTVTDGDNDLLKDLAPHLSLDLHAAARRGLFDFRDDAAVPALVFRLAEQSTPGDNRSLGRPSDRPTSSESATKAAVHDQPGCQASTVDSG